MLESAAKGLSHPRRHSCRTPKDCGKLEDDKCIHSTPPPSSSSPHRGLLQLTVWHDAPQRFPPEISSSVVLFFPCTSSPLMVPSPAQVNPPTSLLDPPLCFLSISFKLWSRTDGRTCSWPKIHPSSGSRLNMAELPPIGDGEDRRWPTGRAGGRWLGWRGIGEEETQTETWSPSVTFSSISSLTSSINTVTGDASVWQRFIRWLLFPSAVPAGITQPALLPRLHLHCLLHMEPKRENKMWCVTVDQDPKLRLTPRVTTNTFYSFIFQAFSTIRNNESVYCLLLSVS